MKKVYKNALLDNTLVDIVTDDKKIIFVGKTQEEGIDLCKMKVLPGLIDIHTHGCTGIDTMDNNLAPLCDFQAKNGVTSFCPTTMTADMESLKKITNIDTSDIKGANIIGFHLEGPYINKDYKGAQYEKYIQSPCYNDFAKLYNISIVTIAPELCGSLEFIQKCNCVVSLGHTGADYDTAIKAFESGANCVTHIFNAMPPLHHRNPSVIGAAAEKDAYIQVICDGLHIHKSVIKILYKAFGADRMIIISDSMRATGLDDGKYNLGGQDVFVNGIEARLSDGTLAGSVTPLIRAIKNLIDWGICEEDAIKMATSTPAQLLNLSKGKIEEGFDADFIVVDDDFNVIHTIIGGEIYK